MNIWKHKEAERDHSSWAETYSARELWSRSRTRSTFFFNCKKTWKNNIDLLEILFFVIFYLKRQFWGTLYVYIGFYTLRYNGVTRIIGLFGRELVCLVENFCLSLVDVNRNWNKQLKYLINAFISMFPWFFLNRIISFA